MVVTSWSADGHGLDLVCAGGRMRLEAVAVDILRVRFTPEAGFAPPRSWDMVALAEPPGELQCRHNGDELAVRAGDVSAHLRLATGALEFRHGAHVFAADLAAPLCQAADIAATPMSAAGGAVPERARTAVTLTKHAPPDESYYGFGQRTGHLNRRNRRLSHWTTDIFPRGQAPDLDNLYQCQPSFVALRPGFAWGLFLHSSWYSYFDVAAEHPERLQIFTLGGELDYYLFAGPTPAAVVEQLTRLTGRPLLPPLWALGFHQSRWGYRSADRIRDVVTGFRARAIPLDAVHLDIDHMRDYRDFTWDPQRFPDPARLVRELHAQDVKAVVIVDPGLQYDVDADYAPTAEGLKRGMLIEQADGGPFIAYCWPGKVVFPDFARAPVREWWGDQHRALTDLGVDGIWNDMNEPALFDRPFGTPGLRLAAIPPDARQGDAGGCHAELHNLYGALMSRATREALQRLRPGRRPWVLTRSAYSGTQRDAVTWMGDNASCWEHLALSLPQLASMGLSGMPHAGVDIGGFYGDAYGELYARWLELGVFYPFMRCHSAQGTRPQEPWCFGPRVEALARAAIEWRYRLLPYLYTLAHRAHRSGEPLLRPLLYDFPDRPELHSIDDQVMLGPALMVAPVCAPGRTRRLVELPPCRWYDFWNGGAVGAGPLIAPAPLGRPPVLVRAGSILTLGNPRQSSAQPLTELTLAVYPGAAGRWTLIEDDGDSTAYREGCSAETDIELTGSGDPIVIVIHERRGRFRPAPRVLTVRVHLPQTPRAVRVDSRAHGRWLWLPDHNAAALSWPDDGAAHRIDISV